ncbi:hypothetical protein A3715_03885 [Oleiphilus sp. HI0009]|uniref:RDD family protein n=1 Tax=unclassified Oleiphilus TaxID=2631174 RepID=UPI0007C3C554|nr:MULTISPECIES: RDD family protein [unclassified Oleiphilus]KZX85473.1 hypothetical protein A3715_03885 [Oleiphilus sp. HI0009]KZY61871.1 hypothetical protein A3738_22110 [Oleiphilus sp. HI0066]KZY70713.1 hypothetical protein A3738_03945 [Oleiphilus sp. HI0066]MCH2158298.1 RDD family protein [Oleiphilaceae bacterium]
MFKKIREISGFADVDLYSKNKEISLEKRSWAFGIDLLVVGLLWSFCYLVGGAVIEAGYTDATADYLIPLFYFLLRDSLPNGQSIGKKLMDIRVMDVETGFSCDLIQSFFRNSLGVTLFVVDILYTHKQFGSKVGDIWSRTIVTTTR